MTTYTRFIESIVKHDFGEVAMQAASALLVKGPQDRAQLAKATRLLPMTLKKCLLALVAHGIVSVTATEVDGPQKTSKKRKASGAAGASGAVRFIYEVDVEAIRHRISYPWYI